MLMQEHDETSEFEESSGASVDDNKEQNDKVDKSGDRDKKRYGRSKIKDQFYEMEL